MEYAEQGFIQFRGHQVWYGVVRDRKASARVPLLAVHGGPGLNHRTLEPLTAIAETGRPVIYYDQLGGGESDRPTSGITWKRALFVEELAAVREALGLDLVHLFGHSYGGALCLEYVLTQQPPGLVSMTLSDSFSSVPALVAGWRSIRSSFPEDVQRTLDRHEEAGTLDDPEYGALLGQHFIAQHVCTVPMSDSMMRAVTDLNNDVYQALHGPSWFQATGDYGTWDVTDRLGEISIPTLLIAGKADQCVPALSEAMHARIPNSQLTILDGASHMPFLERPDEYFPIVTGFLERAESGLRSVSAAN